jgi:hypothetical protein
MTGFFGRAVNDKGYWASPHGHVHWLPHAVFREPAILSVLLEVEPASARVGPCPSEQELRQAIIVLHNLDVINVEDLSQRSSLALLNIQNAILFNLLPLMDLVAAIDAFFMQYHEPISPGVATDIPSATTTSFTYCTTTLSSLAPSLVGA